MTADQKRVWLASKGNEKTLRLAEADGWEVHEVTKAPACNSPEDIRQSMDLLQQIHRDSDETSDEQRWRREAEGTLDKLYSFLQAKNVPHAVDTRVWIENAMRVLDAYEPPSEKATAPTWEDLRGIAPDATGTLSSEEFVRETRNAWDQK